MRFLDTFLYNSLALPVMHGSLKLMSTFNHKIRRGIRARKDLWEKLIQALSEITEERKPRFWIHASSAGEFLQAVPILEEIKVNWPEAVIIFTYFSPSADTLVKSSPLVEISSFLPLDNRENAEKIFSLIQPDILIFSRYDVWPNLVWEAERRRCPAVLINATLSKESLRMSWWGKSFFGRLYSDLELICTATNDDRENFLSFGVPAWKVEVTGDTKYDETYRRVTELLQEEDPLAPFLDTKRVIIGGSTWPPDEKPLLTAFRLVKEESRDAFLIIVPHEPTSHCVEELVKRSTDLGLRPETFSSLKGSGWQVEGDLLIVDRVGILAQLYCCADIAVVGGGFSRGVHNILEPASLGLPIVIGPNYGKSPESIALVKDGGAMVVKDGEDMEETLIELLKDPGARRSVGEAALETVKKNLNATGRTLALLRSTFPTLFPPKEKPLGKR